MERRDFIGRCGLICAAGIGGMTLLSVTGCASPDYAKSTFEGNKLKVLKADFPLDKQFIVLKNPVGEHPIYVHRAGSGYNALLLECTHKGCTVKPSGDELKCPCHGSEYYNSGAVKKGPAQRSLKEYNVTSEADAIFVVIA